MKERLSFVFYLSWKTQIDEMNDEELRRFIENLITWHQGGEVSLPTREDRFIWNGVLPALEVNDKRYVERAGASRENGKLGGRPPKVGKTQITQQVIKEPKKPVNSKKNIVDSEEVKVEGKENIVDSEKVKVEGELNNCKISLKEYRRIFNELFENYPTWEQDLLRYGVNQFLIMNQRFQINNNNFKQMFEEFLSL
jgi:hypothetical protein